jgi:arylsulfatase A-like enzyme
MILQYHEHPGFRVNRLHEEMGMKRRDFVKSLGAGLAAASSPGLLSFCRSAERRPNIIYILADDLGYNELGCYGQHKIRTPHLDRLADQGMRFSQHYAGSPVCAPSRCTLLTGKHTGHCHIRDNDEMRDRGDVWNDPEIEGQRPLPRGTATIGSLLKSAGYVTGAIGKWGLGGPTDEGHPNLQGFDHWYGYLCQRKAHNYYPTHLWRNREKHILNNPFFSAHQRFPEDADPLDPAAYAPYAGSDYAPDLMTGEAEAFIRSHQADPFFLYLAYPIPHLALQVPSDSLGEYLGSFPEAPYLGERGYLPHPQPRAAYAAMITRMDRDIGHILALLEELGLTNNTLILFSSDNGPTYTGGADTGFFQSAGGLRGLKGQLYEGGIRVPMIARWPGRIAPGTQSPHISAFWDVMPTLCEAARTKPPDDCDGISFLPTLMGRPREQRTHPYLYWEFPGYGGQQAVRVGEWKAVRTGLKREDSDTSVQLFNLSKTPDESEDISQQYPEIVEDMRRILADSRNESEFFPFPEIQSRLF